MILSIAKQAQEMQRRWPEFKILAQTDWFIKWEGPLRPLGQTYAVRVLLCLGRKLENAEIQFCPPQVTVIDPLLVRRPESPQDPIPHHYPNAADPARPILCLYDPRTREDACTGEWWFSDSVADTIIPWTINWLACYEGWRATGEWTGGGRHPTD